MRRLYLLLLCCALCSIAMAQVTVTATSGTPGPSNYTSLKAAFDAINTGVHQGNITIRITGNITETATADLKASGQGSALYTAITIEPQGGSFTISGDINAPLINFDGADNVSINGLNAGGNALTITNNNITADAGTSTVRFINDASDNTLQQLSILGAGTSATNATILFSAGATTGNDNNVISNCIIADASAGFPVNAVYAVSVNGAENNNNSITGNNISNFFSATLSSAAIVLSTANTDWNISNNRFYQTATRTFTAGNPQRVIYITSGSNYTISANIIGHASAAGTGVYTIAGAVTTRFLAIDVAVGTALPTIISNNRVSDMSFLTSNSSSGATGIWCAITASAGNVNITGNTVGSTSGTGNITILPQVAGTLTVPITSSSTGIVNISNNIIGSIDILPLNAFSGNMSGIQAQGMAGTVSINNNIIGNTTANNMRIGVAGTTTGNGTLRGVLISNAGTINVTGNTIRNLTHYSNNSLATFRGIEMQNGTGNISDNNISDLTANGVSTTLATPEGAGILVTSSVAGLNIENNSISGLSLINTINSGLILYGIYLSSNSNNYTITRNRIYNFSNASTSASATAPSLMAGIYLRDAVAPNPTTVSNNMISLGNGQTTNTAIIGIWNSINSATGYVARIWHNTVNIEGVVSSGAQPSFCYLRGDFVPNTYNGPLVDIRNNIFTNNRTGGTGKHYAIANSIAATSSATGWGANASNYNILNTANAATVGYWSGDKNFASWQAASSSDANSYSGVAVNYVNSASDLHLLSASNDAANSKATPIASVTTDIDNDIRYAATPDIGADEFTVVFPITFEYFKGEKTGSNNLLQWKGSCSGATVTFEVQHSIEGNSFKKIGSIQATRDRCALPFDFTHANPVEGVNYYRLKIMEADGPVSYSTIIAIVNKNNGFKIVGLYPQITKGNVVLNASFAKNDRAELKVFDISGKQVHQQSVQVVSGSNAIPLQFGTLPAGSYVLAVYSGAEMNTVRFIRQ